MKGHKIKKTAHITMLFLTSFQCERYYFVLRGNYKGGGGRGWMNNSS